MTYNHEETKVRDPSAAKEVERLREELAEARETVTCLQRVFATAMEIAGDCFDS